MNAIVCARLPWFDSTACKQRNVVERCYNRLKQWRDLGDQLVTGAGHRNDREEDAMTDPSTPPALAAALAYHQAWTSQSLDEAMTDIAGDITGDAPGAQISWAQQYRDVLGGFMARLTGVQTVAAFGDDTTAVLFYYPHTGNVSDALTAECFTVPGGKITRSVLVFDRPSFAPQQR